MSRIALVSEHASPLASIGSIDAGGQNFYVANLASALSARGHQVTVYTRRDDPALERRTVVQPRTVGSFDVVHLRAGPPTRIDKDDLFPYMDEFAADLRGCFERDRPDVVHSHFWMSGYAAFAAAGAVHAPLVHTFHALGTVRRRHQGGADRSPPERLGLEHQLLRHADKVVATCSDEVAELGLMAGERLDHTTTAGPAVDTRSHTAASNESSAASSRVAVVPCGFDAQVFRPSGQRLPRNGRPLLAAVARLVPRKGLDVVLQALTEIPDAELLIAGGPPASELAADRHHLELCALADDLGVRSRIRFVGGVSPRAIAAIDRSADLFVAAPRYEPFGIASVEAMACGTPVVATAVGGLLDTVVDGGTGALVPADDPEALARAARDLLGAPARLATTGERAAWRTRQRYSWTVVARGMEDVYREVIAGATVIGGQSRAGTR